MTFGVLFVGNFLSSRGSNPTYAEDMTDRLESRHWPVLRTSSRQSRVLRLADMLATTWSRRRHYELAHIDVFSGPAFLWAETVSFELRRLGKPYILTLRGGNLPSFSRKWPGRVRSLLRAANAVTTPSTYLQSELAHLSGDVIVVPNALDVDRYRFALRSSPKPKLIWVRAFHAVYNPVMAIEVLAQLGAPDASLTMVGVDKGDGSLEQVRERARELGVAGRLELVPGASKSEVARRLANADIFLNTTNVDNAPISVLEAMASGLCVVTTNVGGIPHLLAHDEDALLTAPGDAPAMAASVERILHDRTLAARLSETARARAVERDWSRVLVTWETLFGRVTAHA